jgi:hypothetical protein
LRLDHVEDIGRALCMLGRMQRFFFDFADAPRDGVGSNQPSLDAAEAEARATLLRAAADEGLTEATVAVRDEARQRLLAISLLVVVQREKARG